MEARTIETSSLRCLALASQTIGVGPSVRWIVLVAGKRMCWPRRLARPTWECGIVLDAQSEQFSGLEF
jgi:hypothetical protein